MKPRLSLCSTRGTVAAALVVLVTVGAGVARGTQGDIKNLEQQADLKIVGGDDPTHVAKAGDVNGDGIDDLLVSQGYIGDPPTRGRTWVIFGQDSMPEQISLDDPWTGSGFVIEGADEHDYAFNAAAARDVNGDGLDDIVIGAGGADNNFRSNSGTAYVVFGKSSTAPVSLAQFDAGAQGPLGYRIDGPHDLSFLGSDGVSGAGDMNGDGLADLVLAASFAGRTYVVFGKTDSEPVDLLTFEDSKTEPGVMKTGSGFRIETPAPDTSHYYSVAGVGDVNGDGIPDVVIGIVGRRSGGRIVRQSCACVVFGKSDEEPVNIKRLGDQGFKVVGAEVYWAVAAAGDVNGDGKGDILIGAPYTNHCCGKAYMIFGKKGSRKVKTWDLAGKGIRIVGYVASGGLGEDVDGLGDVNGDGLDDVIVGATGIDTVYALYGKKGTRSIFLKNIGKQGFRMASEVGGTGWRVGGPGDVNNDGIPDIMVGTSQPRAYVVWGSRGAS